jgi:hypothetical protein
MPQMHSLRSFRLETTTGHVIEFEAKVPTYVPPAAVSDAMAAGCVPIDETDVPFLEDLSRSKVEFTGDIRKSMLYLAVDRLVTKNDSKSFDGGGNPKTAPVAEMLGFEVNRAELVSVYQTYLSTKQEERQYALHPAASQIINVLDATDKAELLDLADEVGIPNEKAKGLQVRDLRKMILVKLSGVAA